MNDIISIKDHPYEGAAYVQDKIEVGGMVVNAGLRLDFFNANKNVSSDIYDPLMISALTPGNSGTIGLVGYRPDGSGPGYTRTPTRYAISPRLGISHPITETTVLHFMFGIFNQRPPWQKLLANSVVWTDTRGFDPKKDELRMESPGIDAGHLPVFRTEDRKSGTDVGEDDPVRDRLRAEHRRHALARRDDVLQGRP